MFGEIPSLKAAAHAPTAPTTAGNELRLMRSDGLIRYHKHADRVRTFRISDPGGFEAIGEMDARLLRHAELLVGKKGARYPGGKEYRIKKRKEAVLMFDLLSSGYLIDGTYLDEEKHLNIISPDITKAEDIIKSVPEDVPLVLSGLLLKHRGAEVTLNRREMSTCTGAVFSRGGIYVTYCISSARHRWYAVAELTAANEITRLYEDAKGLKRGGDGRRRAIVYADTSEIAAALISTTGKGSQKMDPTTIYKLTYLVPRDDRDFSMDVTRMLTIPDWRIKTDRILGLSPSGKHDGKTEDDRNIYNLLCCNLAKLHEVSGEIRRNKCKLVLHDWQKPILEELYETEIDAISLSPKHFKGLLMTILENEE